jgi:anhydro-N-acetylmuramic acid kinase
MHKNVTIPSPEEWFSRSRYVLGIMTGTSIDGVDITLAKFLGSKSKKFIFTILGFESFPFPKNIREKIEAAVNNNATTRDVAWLNFELARLFAKMAVKFLNNLDVPLDKVDAIGVHGQTIWHEPKPTADPKNGFTMQIVSLPAMAAILKVPIVGDFRSKDIALGGEGAPLVPIFDFEFLASKDKDVIALNIGGIANITYLPKGCRVGDVVAFDTGPGNVWIDGATKIFFGLDFDKDGSIARAGQLNNALFKKLKSIPFVRQKPPKSTGRELFSMESLQKIIEFSSQKKIPKENVISTLTHFTAWSIAGNVRKFANPASRIVVSGGGAKNSYLLELLSSYLSEAEIITSDEVGIPTQAKESLAFAFLAYLRMGNIPSNIPRVTGAKEKVSLGIIAL